MSFMGSATRPVSNTGRPWPTLRRLLDALDQFPERLCAPHAMFGSLCLQSYHT